MEIEIVRSNGMVKIYELTYVFDFDDDVILDDKREEILSIEYAIKGRKNTIAMIKYIISYVYDYKFNPLKKQMSSEKRKHTRAINYVANNSIENMSESKKEKYLNKIKDTKHKIAELQYKLGYWKNIINCLYKNLPEDYSKITYIKKLENDKLELLERLMTIDLSINRLKNEEAI
ncbi:MAG: hypothetical protein K0S61_2552 [Anaerocolumna sp.]|jgi:hypothetical protein|nr:hypothetical protein [Anaerocolumna sp.]